jgi:hypothetical protein
MTELFVQKQSTFAQRIHNHDNHTELLLQSCDDSPSLV